MDLDAYTALAEWAVTEHGLAALRISCIKPGESDNQLDARLLRAGWTPRALYLALGESLQPGSAALIRSQVGNIAREVRKLGRVDTEGRQVNPNWDLVALSFWRAMDRWVTDSTRDATFLGRLWKKLALNDSLEETTMSSAAGSYLQPVRVKTDKEELKAQFPGADESYLDWIVAAYSGNGSPSPRRTKERT